MMFFLKVDFIGFFRELNLRTCRKFFPDDFYDNNIDFLQKDTESGKPESGGCRDPGFRYLE